MAVRGSPSAKQRMPLSRQKASLCGFSVGPHSPAIHIPLTAHEQKPLCSHLPVLRIPFYGRRTVIAPAGSKLAHY